MLTRGQSGGYGEHLYRFYNSDSEMHAFYILSQIPVLQSIINQAQLELKKTQEKDEEIIVVEFHGCTTRDMCPLCYTNMNCIQFLANKDQSIGFLARIKNMIEAENAQGSKSKCDTISFISSLRQFPENGNHLWVHSMEDWPNIGFVHQFRLESSASSSSQ